MQKYSAIALLGATNAVITPGPVVITGFPKFATPHTIVTADKDTTSGAIKVVFSQVASANTATSSTVRGYRNDLYAFPTQNIAQGAAALHATVAAPTATTRTFYQTASSQLGTSAPAAAATTEAITTIQAGAGWVVCEVVTKDYMCNSAVSYISTGTAHAQIVGRVSAKVAATGAFALGATAASNFISWNTDLFLAAQYHSAATTATPIATGAAWCSMHDNKILKDGTMVPFTAQMGLTGRTKCTWQLVAEDNTVGPAFQIKTSATYVGFYAHWVEWAGTAALSAGQTLAAASSASFHLGAYAAGTNGAAWLNPASAQTASTTTWAMTALQYTASSTDPNLSLPGSIGSIKYFPGYDGDAKEVQMSNFDSMQVVAMYNMKKGDNDSFNNLNSDYEKKRVSYDDATTAEKTRLDDALKAAFEPMISIPKRPCAPLRPSSYNSVYLKLDDTAVYGATRTAAGWQGNLVQTLATDDAANDTKVAKVSVHKGYIYPNKDTTATAALGDAGHIFGRLGQSKQTLPGAMSPFVWFPIATGNKATIQISFFPVLDADAGLATTQTILCEAKAQAFASLSSFGPPGQPGEAKQPMKAIGASFLALGATSALVLATLI